MKNFEFKPLAIFLALLFTCSFYTLTAQDSENAAVTALQPFEHLIGGKWHIEGSYQVFEWGVGKKSVQSRSYFIMEGEAVLVSQGQWFWHPGDQKIKGHFTAINMPVSFFDYTTKFDGRTMINDLISYSSSGTVSEYVETMEFTDDNSYTWKLSMKSSEGLQEVMSASYIRK